MLLLTTVSLSLSSSKLDNKFKLRYSFTDADALAVNLKKFITRSQMLTDSITIQGSQNMKYISILFIQFISVYSIIIKSKDKIKSFVLQQYSRR